MKTSALATQVGGDHYKGVEIQHFTFCQRNDISWGLASVLKYVIRYQRKHGFEDLKKALHYLLLWIEEYDPDLFARRAADGFAPCEGRTTYKQLTANLEGGWAISPIRYALVNKYPDEVSCIAVLIGLIEERNKSEGDGIPGYVDELHGRLHDLMKKYYPAEYENEFSGSLAPLDVVVR